jgi:hypothetical protein
VNWNILRRNPLFLLARCPPATVNGVHEMKRIVASLSIAVAMLVFSQVSASAWTCLAEGFGRTATGHGFDIEVARWYALARCEERAGGPCVIVWCRD